MSRETKRSGPVDHSKPPPHLDFLFILVEFSHRLLVVDRCGDKGVLPFLTKQLPEGRFKKIQEEKPASWEPLITYYQVTRPNKGGVAFSAGNKGKKRPLKGESALGGAEIYGDQQSPFFYFTGGEGWLSARPGKVPRVETTPPGSEVGSEEGGSESGSPPAPAVVAEGRKTRRKPQQRKGLVHEA